MSAVANPVCTPSQQLLYNQLPQVPGQHWIRLLNLHPSNGSQVPSCSFSNYSLENAPPYRALSYAWLNEHYIWNEQPDGSPAEDAKRAITCNGRSVFIGANLYSALHHLREPHQPKFLWIDAICINQNDPNERTHQVLQMRNVYRKSVEVIIWLGERRAMDNMGDAFFCATGSNKSPINFHGDHRDKVMLDAFLKREGRRRNIVRGRDVFGAFCVLSLLAQGQNAAQIKQISKQNYIVHIIKGLEAISEQSWWRRSWVIQEVVVATEAVICYGNISVPWDMFARAADTYERDNLDTNVDSVYSYLGQLTRLTRLIKEIETARQMWWDERQQVTLPKLLSIFRPKGASDPRDKVYCLVGLVQNWAPVNKAILPDYTLGEEHVFLQTTITLIQLTKSLSVLNGTLQRPRRLAMPSWVVDWSSQPDLYETIRIANSRHYHAAVNNPLAVRPVKLHLGRVLEIQGNEVDQIAVIASQTLPLDDEGLGPRWRFVIDEWERVAGGPSGAFWQTLCGDLEYGKDREAGSEFCRVAESQWETYASWRDADRFQRKSKRFSVPAGLRSLEQNALWAEKQSLRDSQDAQAKHVFQYSVECASGGRRFFVTKKGHLGTGPDDSMVGDSVVIPDGTRVPWIMRKSPSVLSCQCSNPEILIPGWEPVHTSELMTHVCNPHQRQSFSLIGDAYVQGIMDGEAGLLSMQQIFVE